MNLKCKRLFSLLLALALIFSLTTTAFAAEAEGSSEPETTATEVLETEPEETPEETTEPEPEPTEPTEEPTEAEETPTAEDVEDTEPTDADEPETPEEEAPEEPVFTVTPDPIMEYNPYDPDWPYPYGIPVDNDFPEDLLEPDPYGIMLLADMSLIPDEMYDNSILRALAYTGYDVDYLKDNGYLYVAQYVSSNINTYAPQVLSGIGYDDYSPYVNGDETVTDSSTISGKVPDMDKFRDQGFVCASFVCYYLCNYLPNIEGIDTTWMHIVRYADDFRIFCSKKSDAEKTMVAVTEWLAERLKLEVSPEKTRIVNVKRKYSEFLGFKIKVHQKGHKYGQRRADCLSESLRKRPDLPAGGYDGGKR